MGEHVAIMAPISLTDIIAALPSEDSWGPPTSTETTLNGVPYAPYSKGDKLGRMADWTTEGKDGRDGRGGRQQYNRNYRDQQVYGAGTSSLFAVQLAEDESSFSVVSNTRDSTKTRFGRRDYDKPQRNRDASVNIKPDWKMLEEIDFN